MIEASTNYTLLQGSKMLLNALDMEVTPVIVDNLALVRLEINAITDTAVLAGGNAWQHTIERTYTELNAFTASGSTQADKFFNQCEQAVVAYLEGITENASVTFTIV